MPENEVMTYLSNVRAIQRQATGNEFRYGSVEDLLLREGINMPYQALPETIRHGAPRFCFHNARKLVCDFHPRYLYVEGYACGIVPVLHAWCYDLETGCAVDPTWEQETCQLYVGVPILTRYLIEHDLKSKHASILDDWKAGWPLLRMDPAEWKFTP